MDIEAKKIFKTLNPRRAWLPIIIGAGILIFIFARDETLTFDKLKLVFDAALIPLFFTFLVIFARDFGYVSRIKTITNNELTWTSSIYIIIFWEFASAVTPFIVGGTTVVVFILLKEGISFGKSIAYVMVTAIFDNLFFLVAAPFTFIFISRTLFPENPQLEAELGDSMQVLFFVSYGLIALYTLLMSYAIFINSRAVKLLFLKITSIKFLRRWRYFAHQQGDEMIMASEILKGKGTKYWLAIAGLTVFIWVSRYAIVNCLIEAFFDYSLHDHFLIFARHLMMWVIMLISPTPGSSGTAEFFFPQFFNQFLGEYTMGVVVLWRVLTYYLYLLLGVILLPKWIKRVFFEKKEKAVNQ